MQKITKITAAGMLAGALLMAFPSAAQADSQGTVKSNPWCSPAEVCYASGSKVTWHYSSYNKRLSLTVCDTAADGKGAVGVLYGTNYEVWDRNGANNSCNEQIFTSVPTGQSYDVWACIGVYATRAVSFCDSAPLYT